MIKSYTPWALYGTVLTFVAAASYLLGVAIAIPRRVFMPDSDWALTINTMLVWYSGVPLVTGLSLIAIDLFLILPLVKRDRKFLNIQNNLNQQVTVVLTAYNDEVVIADSVRDFLNNPKVKRVVVISNNSTDHTIRNASEAGALTYNEEIQGYGACVFRALQIGSSYVDTELTLLCEGDMTFRASDLDKFLSYLPHADIVCGSRTNDTLQEFNTQLSTFMHYGNFFVSKLLEAKHIGRCSLSDVGCTYKLCRNSALTRLLPFLSPYVNLEFNPYFLDKAIGSGLKLVECPITFHPRGGKSKGGNVNNKVAFKLGLVMILGIILGWKEKRS